MFNIINKKNHTVMCSDSVPFQLITLSKDSIIPHCTNASPPIHYNQTINYIINKYKTLKD